jgi:RHS repeat-associated protein
MRRSFRRISVPVLVYFLCASMLIGQEKALVQPLTSAPAPVARATVPISLPAATATAAPSRTPTTIPRETAETTPSKRGIGRIRTTEDASGSLAAATTIEPQYFTGQLRGSYPVSVPKGRGGLTPTLSLDYHSAAGNGWLGVGWQLEAGAIERQSSYGIDYNNDRYVFRTSQGVETLVARGGTSFATEIATRFEKFEKRVAADGRPYWVVTDTKGTVREYGTTAASRLANPAKADEIFSWRLSRVTDPLGNAITATYISDGGNLYLRTIRYTESPGLAATNTITFESEPRADVDTSYQLGFRVQTALRLARIVVDAGPNRLPSLRLNYGTASDATQRSLLRSVVVLASDGTQALPATQYDYQGGLLTFSVPVREGGPNPKDPLEEQCLTADFNGDSLTDVACYSGNNGLWNLSLSSLTGFISKDVPGGPGPGNPTQNCTTADLNADGRSDLLCYTKSGGQWWRMFGDAEKGLGELGTLQASSTQTPISASCVMGDMNADGRADMACAKGGKNWQWTLSNQEGWAPTINVQGPDPGANGRNVGNQCFAADLNADRRTDIACYEGANGKWNRGIATDTGWVTTAVKGPSTGNPIGGRSLFGDFNGDHRTDILVYAGSSNPGNQWHLAFATDSGFDTAVSFIGPTTSSSVNRTCVALDFNGDGKTDLTCNEPDVAGRKAWHTYVSSSIAQGDERDPTLVSIGKTTGPALSNNAPLYQRCTAGDFNGDAKGDVACRITGGSWQFLLSDGITSDLMSSTTTIFGGTTSFEYGRAATMSPDIAVPIDVVVRSASDDGSGRKAVTDITYTGGYFHVAQRDFRGFRAARVAGPQTGGVRATTVLRYHQGSSVEFGADDPEDETAFMRGRLDRIRILDEKGQVARETAFIYGASDAIPRFNPVVETRGSSCENEICRSTHVLRSYDRFGNVVRVEDYGDTDTAEDDVTSVITYAYNEALNLVSLPASQEVFTGVPGTQRLSYSRFFYDSTNTCATPSTVAVPTRGLVTRVTRWVGGGVPDVETRAAFDSVGNVICSVDPLGNRTTSTFDANKEFLLSSENALGHRTTFSYYGVAGQSLDRGLYGAPKSVTDPNGGVTTTEWDRLGRRVKTTRASGASISWTYANLGTPFKQALRTESGGLSTWTTLDGFGRPVSTRRSGPQLKFIMANVRFNDRGLVDAVSLPYFEGSTPIGETSTVYDALRRPISQVDAAGGRRTICYSSGATDFIDENGHRTRNVVTATGRLVRAERFAGVYSHDCNALLDTAPYSITQYRHDALGRLTRIIDPKGIATSISWDGLNRRTQLVDPAVGERRFSFDAAGNEISWQSSSGAAVFVRYDALGRPVQKDYTTQKPLGQGDVINTYDQAGRNGIGRLTGTRNTSAARSISYDLEGRPTAIDHVIMGTTYREGRSYDALGRVTEIRYPDGKRVANVYDGPTLAHVRTADGAVSYASFSGYNAVGFPSTIRFDNGVTTELEYETGSSQCPQATYRLCSSTTRGRDLTSQLLQLKYEYDAKGNITSAREGTRVRSFIYDEFDRLRGVATSDDNIGADRSYRQRVVAAEFPRDWAALSAGSLSAPRLDEGFSYDRSDDLTWKYDVGAYDYPDPSGAVMNPHAPRRIGDEQLSWDRNGNLQAVGKRKMAYDAESRLVAIDFPSSKRRAARHDVTSDAASVRSLLYEYAADGSRVRETGPNGITVYVGEIAECRVGGTCVNHVFAGSQRIATVASDGRTAYFHRDALASTRLMSDAQGQVSARYTYASYGSPLAAVTSPAFVSTNFLFGSQPFSSDAGVYLFGSRAYDPQFGQFLSPDEIIPVPGSPQYLNRYSYALGNPSSMIDPDGHFAFLTVLIGVVLGAVAGGVIAHLTGGDWRAGALLGAVTGAFFTMSNGFSAELLEKAALKIATGAAKGAISAFLEGENIGRGALTGGLNSLADVAANAFVLPADLWGDNAGAFAEAAQKLTNATLQGAATGGWRALVSGHSIPSGVRKGARDGLVGELKKELAEFDEDDLKSMLSSFSLLPEAPNGQFVHKTPFFGNVEDSATSVINSSTTNVRLKPDDSWTFVQSRSGRQESFFGATFTPAHALSTGLGAAWGTTKTAVSQPVGGSPQTPP